MKFVEIRLAVYGKYGNQETEHLTKMPQSSDDGYLAVCGSPTNICPHTHTYIFTTFVLSFLGSHQGNILLLFILYI